MIDQIAKTLVRVRDKVDARIESMQITFENRSESWQSSDKGDQYKEKLQEFNELYTAIDEAIYAAQNIEL